MEMIRQDYHIFNKPEGSEQENVLKFIENIGRICYKSEDKITDDSYLRFIKMLKERKHWAMLEHYIFALEVNKVVYSQIEEERKNITYAKYYDTIDKFKYIQLSSHYDEAKEAYRYIVSTSATALNYLISTSYFKEFHDPCGISGLHKFLYNLYPELFISPRYEINDLPEGYIRLLSKHEMNQFDRNVKLLHNWASVLFITNIGISHELVRHRPCSFAQESTRYVKYSDGLIAIEPSALGIKEEDLPLYENAISTCEQNYRSMISKDYSAQQAAGLLPKATKTEIVITARLLEWKHIFDMRADRAAHPQMRQLLYSLLVDFTELFPDCFNDQRYRVEVGIEDGWIESREGCD